jgi:hypothetical protein
MKTLTIEVIETNVVPNEDGTFDILDARIPSNSGPIMRAKQDIHAYADVSQKHILGTVKKGSFVEFLGHRWIGPMQCFKYELSNKKTINAFFPIEDNEGDSLWAYVGGDESVLESKM